jgi:glycosyltransferase 2 family protein
MSIGGPAPRAILIGRPSHAGFARSERARCRSVRQADQVVVPALRRADRLVDAEGLGSFWPRPRVRRPLDGARLLVAAAALAALVVLAVVDPGLVQASARVVPAAVRGLPRTVLSIANVVTSFAVLAVLLAIAVDAVRLHRFALTSGALGCVLGVLAGLALASLAGAVAGDPVTAMLIGPPHESAGLPITAAVGLVVGADPQRRRWSGAALLALSAAVTCAIALGSLTVASAAYAVLTGAFAGLVVRVVLGVVPARPPHQVVEAVLARAGWAVSDLRVVEQAAGRVTYAARGAAADDLRVTVVDPDRRGVPFARRAWRILRLRSAAVGRPALSLRGQLERQALSGALAGSAGVATPHVLALLAAGPALVLVEQPLTGTPLPTAPDVERAVAEAWAALRRLHAAGIAHGGPIAEQIIVLPNGRAGFAALRATQPAATDLQRELDVVALLVSTARLVGAKPAVAALRSGYATTAAKEARLAALVQPLALPRSVRHAVRGTPLLHELRTSIVGEPGAGTAELPRLERLRARTVITIAGGTVAAHVLATQLSTVNIAGTLQHARPSWAVVALLGSALTYVGAALARQAFAPVRVPFTRTARVQLAASFLTLVTPPAVGHVSINIRYLQRAGAPTAAAAASVGVSEAVTVAVTLVVLLVCGWLSGLSQSRLTLLPSGNVLAVLLVAATALALAAAAPPTRRLLRRRLEPLVRGTLPQLVAAASDPRRLATAVIGVVVLNTGYVLALDASLRAFSASLALPALIVVYLAASTLGSAVPTPGGLGAVEAALVGGLTTTGVPVGPALAAVLLFRTATFWLPAPIGWGTFIALQRRGFI